MFIIVQQKIKKMKKKCAQDLQIWSAAHTLGQAGLRRACNFAEKAEGLPI